MSAGSWPPGQPSHGPSAYGPSPYGPPSHGPPPYGPARPPYGPGRTRATPAPTTLILARVASIGLSAIALVVGFLGSAVIMTPTTMMFTGCSGDSACLRQFFWVFVLPPLGCGLGMLAALIGTIVHWRSHWVITWGVIAIGLTVAGIIAALRVAGYWPPA